MNIRRNINRATFAIALSVIALTACDKDVFDINTDPF